MWPFSTLKHLRWEIEQANTANGIMRTALTRRDERIAILDKQIAHRDADNRQFASQVAGLQSLNKSLAAERDEAVLRARKLSERESAARNAFSEQFTIQRRMIDMLHHQLQGAFVRDKKTGRMTKWVDQIQPIATPKIGMDVFDDLAKIQEQIHEAPFDFLGTGVAKEPVFATYEVHEFPPFDDVKRQQKEVADDYHKRSETNVVEQLNPNRRWRDGKWEYSVIDHIDGNPQNNALDNLRHVWPSERAS